MENNMEQAIRQLLKPPGLQYMREIRRILDRDPDYLHFHSASVSLKVNELLRVGERGSNFISEHDVEEVVRETIVRLRSVER